MMDSQRTKGLWRTGKDEFKKFMKIKFKKSTNFVSYMFGILLTALPIFPIVWFIFELVEVYWYNIDVVYIFLLSAWVLFMFCNGLSNYITIKILKAYEKDTKTPSKLLISNKISEMVGLMLKNSKKMIL